MRYPIAASIAALCLISTPARAQDNAMKGMAPDLSSLPQACRDALKDVRMPGMMDGSGMMKMMEGMDMSKPMGGMGSPGAGQMPMNDAQKASMQAMMKMHMPMMATHMIKDPDLAFNCGMIVHHQGAIDMANVVIKFGKDEASKAMAAKIVKDQTAEIAEMTARVSSLPK